jgi:hypothetical protein
MEAVVNERVVTIRAMGDSTFRRTVGVLGDATLAELSAARPYELLQGALPAPGEDDDSYRDPNADPFWRDHPSAVLRSHWAPEEPYALAGIGGEERPLFWKIVVDDAEAAMQRMQTALDGYLVIDGQLWRPCELPGWSVDASKPPIASRWMEGLSLDDRSIHYYDHHERAACRRLGADVPDDPVPRLTATTDSSIADLRVLRLALGALVKRAPLGVASRGVPFADLYWRGRISLEEKNPGAIVAWLTEFVVEMHRIEPLLADHAALLQQRAFNRFDLGDLTS